MGLVSDFEKYDKGREVKNAIDEIDRFVTRIDDLLGKMSHAGTLYPAVQSEMDGYIIDRITAIEALVAKYKK